MTEKELIYHRLLKQLMGDIQDSMVRIETERYALLTRYAKLEKRAVREVTREEACKQKD